MSNKKNLDFLNGKPPAPPKPEPFKRQSLGYKRPDGTFVETGKPDKKKD